MKKAFYLAIMIIMTLTVIVSIIVSSEPFSFSHPYNIAIAIDLYLMLLLFYYVQIYKKERSLSKRILWFVILIFTGSIGASIYLLKDNHKI